MSDEPVIQALLNKIADQAVQIAALQDQLNTHTSMQIDPSYLASTLSSLRLHGAVLVYVGSDRQSFDEQVLETFGDQCKDAIYGSLFILENAPVSVETREEMNKAFKNGMNRW